MTENQITDFRLLAALFVFIAASAVAFFPTPSSYSNYPLTKVASAGMMFAYLLSAVLLLLALVGWALERML